VKLKIRRTDDLELIKELSVEHFPDYKLEEEELEGAEWWLALLDGKPIGCAGLWVDSDRAHKAWLCRGLVAPEARGMGIQKRLIRARLRYAKKNNIPRVYTNVVCGNFASMRSLLACGLKPYYISDDNLYLETSPAP
jgi:RimJ/RimL family protein N-acetyltransferase